MMTAVAGSESQGLAVDKTVNTLHYYPFSLYSIIVRFAIELGRSSNPETSPNVALRLVNLKEGENLTEDFLALNAKGQVRNGVVKVAREKGGYCAAADRAQVPALDTGTDVLTESFDILNWLSRIQPTLMPESHQEDILSQLEAFYGFHAQPLAVKPEALSWGIPNKALEILENPDISETYRRSLEIRSVL